MFLLVLDLKWYRGIEACPAPKVVRCISQAAFHTRTIVSSKDTLKNFERHKLSQKVIMAFELGQQVAFIIPSEWLSR